MTIFLKDLLKEEIDLSTIDIIKEECSEAVAKYLSGGSELYRGSRDFHNPIEYFNPTSTERVSANTSNFFTLFTKGTGQWEAAGIPLRNKSIIMSTSTGVASSYGKTYQVFPVNGAKIAYGVTEDNWMNYARGSKLVFGEDVYVETFNDTIYKIIEMCVDKTTALSLVNETRFEELKKVIDIVKLKLPNLIKYGSVVSGWHVQYAKKMVEYGGVWKSIKTYIDPKINKITYERIKDLSLLGTSVECWTDSPCYFIEQHFDGISPEIKRLLAQKL